MCGILAVCDPLKRSGDAAGIERGLASMEHRGPDARGAWRSPDGIMTLGHTRLSIIDLETGDQPIANEDGTLHVVVNGEFYDFETIRASLESRGHVSRT